MKNLLLTSLAAAAIALGAAGCDTDDGPMEEAGKKLDESYQDTVASMEEAAEETGDKIEDAADEMK